MKQIHLVNFHHKIPKGAVVVNTTSRSTNWSKGLSPFFLGPVKLYGNYTAKVVENGWQYTKLFSEYSDQEGNPTEKYFEWAEAGWNNPIAVRYPMGKGVKLLYSYWDGEKLPYVEARKRIYIPLYSQAVAKTDAYKELKELWESLDEDLYLQDYDSYQYRHFDMTYYDVMNDPVKKMGHAFVLAMMLENII